MPRSCCATCRIPNYLKGTECPYGDDNLVTVGSKTQSCQATFHTNSRYKMCQKPAFKMKCCKSCQIPDGALPDCPYGDDVRISWDGVQRTCPEVAATTGKNALCHLLPEACCGTCHIPDHLEGLECPHGDDNYLSINDEQLSCQDAFNKYGKTHLCQNPFVNKRCCKSCQIPVGAPPDCPYGDEDVISVNNKSMSCQAAFNSFGKARMCAIPNYNKKCCQSCQILPGAPADCPYGDDPTVRINNQWSSCEQAIAIIANMITDQSIFIRRIHGYDVLCCDAVLWPMEGGVLACADKSCAMCRVPSMEGPP
ncbi:hypothetical protein ElyMa_005458300 [Elysia marginata]|uniref:PLAC domain-containing protein n=1 Tax=Elysia marginata TaxID=1093978 RepID=A0AAV4EN24_9GAST|nr:hypothetical protein ElyMa_005458300 [Elysia marginata]